MRCFALTSLLWCALASAGTAELSWTAPTHNVDGSVLTDLDGFRLYRSCGNETPTLIADVQETERAYTDIVDAPGQTCSWWASAYNAINEESARTGPVSKTFALDPVALPGAVSATFTWQATQEPEPMAVVYEGVSSEASADFGGGNGNVSTSPPSGLAAGDVWIIFATGDSDTSATIGVPSGFTAVSSEWRYGTAYPIARVFWKIAGASESAVNVAFTAVWEAQTRSVRVSGANSTPIDTYANASAAGNATSLDAPDATVASDGSLALLFLTLHSNPQPSSITPPSGSTLVASKLTAYDGYGIAHQSVNAGSFAPGNWSWASAGNPNLAAQTVIIKPSGGAAAASLPPINNASRMAAMIAH